MRVGGFHAPILTREAIFGLLLCSLKHEKRYPAAARLLTPSPRYGGGTSSTYCIRWKKVNELVRSAKLRSRTETYSLIIMRAWRRVDTAFRKTCQNIGCASSGIRTRNAEKLWFGKPSCLPISPWTHGRYSERSFFVCPRKKPAGIQVL